MRMKLWRGSGGAALLMALVCATLLLAAPACGKKEEAVPEGSAVAPPTEAPAAGDAPTPEPVSAAPQPVTMPALQLAPEGATVAVAIPPMTGLYDKLVGLSRRMALPEQDVDSEMLRVAHEMGAKWGVQGDTIPAVLEAKGIDTNRPMAMFMDMADAQPMMREFGGLLAKLIVQSQGGLQMPGIPGVEAPGAGPEAVPPAAPEVDPGAAPEPIPEADPGTAPDATPETVSRAGLGPEIVYAAYTEDAQAPGLPDGPAVEALPDAPGAMPAPDVAPPAVPPVDPSMLQAKAMQFLMSIKTAVVLPVTSEEAADTLFAMQEAPQTVDANGVTVKSFMTPIPWGYFVRDNWLVVSNSTPYLSEVAKRFDQPAEFRYGSESCPPTQLDEMVGLTRVDQLMPMLADMLEGMGQGDPMMAMMIQMQAAGLQQLRDAYQSPDPLVTTMAWNDERIEVLSRLDTREFPKVLELQGEPTPSRHAGLLPETTTALWSMQLTPESKAALENQWIGAVPQDMQQDPSVQQGLGMLRLFMGIMGREVTVAVEGATGSTPRISALFDLENVDVAKNLLSATLGIPLNPAETYNGLGIMESTVKMPGGSGLYFAFPEGMGIMATGPDALKALIDRMNQGATGGLVSTLDPPLDTSIPRYTTLVVRDTIVSEMLIPVMSSQGEIDAETAKGLQYVVDRFSEVRATSELRDGWLTSIMSVRFD